jgi:hypothetical protein
MTALACMLEKQRALIATDTMIGGGGQQFVATKTLALMAQRVVIAVEGAAEALSFVLAHSVLFHDFDSAVDAMPEILAAASETLDIGPQGTNIGTNVYVIGYSRKRAAMTQARWKTRDGKNWQVSFVDASQKSQITISPQVPASLLGGSLPSSSSAMGAFMRRAAAHWQARDLLVGGRCILTIIDRHGMHLSEPCELGMPATVPVATEPLTMTLQEDSADIYDEADAAVADPTPNTRLPNPMQVLPITNLQATSNSTTALRSNLGVITPRVSVTWDAVTSRYVLEKGRIRIRWFSGTQPWVTQDESGNATGTYIVGPQHGDRIIIEVYAINALGKEGPPVQIAHTVSGAASIGTVQIAPNAVVDPAITATPADGSISYTSGTQPRVESSGSIGSATYTAPASSGAQVSCSWSTTLNIDVNTSGTAVGKAIGTVTITVGGSTVFTKDVSIEGATGAGYFNMSGSFPVTASAGQAVVLTLTCGRSFSTSGTSPAQTITWKSTALSLIPFKR